MARAHLTTTFIVDATTIDLIRTIATVIGAFATTTAAVAALMIPRRLAARAASREKVAATLSLLNELKTATSLQDRTTRTYARRRFEKGLIEADPYEGTIFSFRQDAFAIIGFYDAACAQIVHDFVHEDIIREASGGSIVGAYEWLQELETRYKHSQAEAFPSLMTIGRRWDAKVPASQRSLPPEHTEQHNAKEPPNHE